MNLSPGLCTISLTFSHFFVVSTNHRLSFSSFQVVGLCFGLDSIYSQLLRLSTARMVGYRSCDRRFKACKSILFTNDPSVNNISGENKSTSVLVGSSMKPYFALIG